MILITGATGRTGKDAALLLAKQGVKVRALVRNPEKAAPLQAAGVEVAIGDASDAVAVRAALAGVTKLAVILPNGQQQLALEKHLTDLAAAAGVKHILKVSSMEATASATNPVHITHWESEQHIRASGMAWTMVRPSFYLQNFLRNAATIKSQNQFSYPCGDSGGAVFSDVRDVAFFIAHVFTTPGHETQSYDITSHDRLSFHAVAAVMSQELGRTINYVPMDPAAYKAVLSKTATSQWHLDAVSDIFAEIAAGYLAETTNTFKQVTGREPVGLAQFMREHAALFRA